MENYCIMVQTGSEEKFKEEATSRLSEIENLLLLKERRTFRLK